MDVDIFDPWVDQYFVKEKYGIEISGKVNLDKKYTVVISTVAYEQFLEMRLIYWKALVKKNGI